MNVDKLKEKAITREDAFCRLMDIVTLLRKECPWDREQTHQSLKICMIEEAYEVCNAIDKEDGDNLKEELGDVLLQVIFHSTMAFEESSFDIIDVINEECEKMIRRHPHIFSKKMDKTLDNILEKWENIKRNEHSYNRYVDELENVPNNLPALMRAYKVQKKAAGCGFDWDDVNGALEKLQEEIGEFQEAIKGGKQSEIEDEFGDILFSMVNVARFENLNPELALTASTEKFIKRFKDMEELAIAKGLDLKDMSLEEMDFLWDEVKKAN